MRLPISYFGNIEYWQLAISEQKQCIEVHETFVKQSLRNRCEIIGANGLMHLTASVQGRSKGLKTKDVKLDFSENWPQQHWHSIKSAYGHAAYYEYYFEAIESFYQTCKKHTFLVDFCWESIVLINNLLESKVNFYASDKFQMPAQNELRQNFKSSKKSTKFVEYYQTFSDRFSFESNLCILDLIFNCGNTSLQYLKKHQ